MKNIIGILGVLSFTLGGFGSWVQAAEQGNRENVEKFDKEIAKDKEDISKKLTEIKTLQTKLDQDMAQFGQTSNEVKGDQDKLKDLRKDLGEKKIDLFKNTLHKKLESGESIESEATSC